MSTSCPLLGRFIHSIPMTLFWHWLNFFVSVPRKTIFTTTTATKSTFFPEKKTTIITRCTIKKEFFSLLLFSHQITGKKTLKFSFFFSLEFRHHHHVLWLKTAEYSVKKQNRKMLLFWNETLCAAKLLHTHWTEQSKNKMRWKFMWTTCFKCKI